MDFRETNEVDVFAGVSAHEEPVWDIPVGAVVKRSEVHDRFGGSRQGGIASAPKVRSVLLFSSKAGERYGYGHDGPRSDGSYHYTGEGQVGDQHFVRGNNTVLKTDRPLRLFKEVSKGHCQYLGVFARDKDDPWYRADALDRNDEPRSVIVFRLRPAERQAQEPSTPARRETEVLTIPVESYETEKYVSKPKNGFTVAERREADLVKRYAAWLDSRGREAKSRKICLAGDMSSLFVDVYDEGLGELIEAKSSASRHHIRLALGQILDYERYVDHSQLAVLVPVRPAADLIDLLKAHGINCIYETTKGEFDRVQADAAIGTARPIERRDGLVAPQRF